MKRSQTYSIFKSTHLPKLLIVLMFLFHFSNNDFGVNFSDTAIEIVDDSSTEDEKDSEENLFTHSNSGTSVFKAGLTCFIVNKKHLGSFTDFCEIPSQPPERL
jgi:hypothetical protein